MWRAYETGIAVIGNLKAKTQQVTLRQFFRYLATDRQRWIFYPPLNETQGQLVFARCIELTAELFQTFNQFHGLITHPVSLFIRCLQSDLIIALNRLLHFFAKVFRHWRNQSVKHKQFQKVQRIFTNAAFGKWIQIKRTKTDELNAVPNDLAQTVIIMLTVQPNRTKEFLRTIVSTILQKL